MKALMARKTEEMDVQTGVIATALNISFSAEALAEWRMAHGIAAPPKAPIDAQSLGLMMAKFPGAFRVH